MNSIVRQCVQKGIGYHSVFGWQKKVYRLIIGKMLLIKFHIDMARPEKSECFHGYCKSSSEHSNKTVEN